MCHTGPAPDTDFNPRPPRGGRRGLSATNIRYTAISIHAPREGGDFQYFKRSCVKTDISIHAPRVGGDGGINYPPPYKEDFNPRPPRGGRRFVRIVSLSLPIISIHAPREGGDPEYGYVLGGCHGISIHAPREGGDSPVFGMTTYSI